MARTSKSDVLIVGGGLAGSDQPYREKIREALRLGFVIHWVFHTDHQDQMQAAREALSPELSEPFEFGTYDPRTDYVAVGTPITYKNYAFPVERMAEFSPRAILGYRAGAAAIGRRGIEFDLGVFEFAGVQRRIIANRQGTYFRAVPPNQPVEDAEWGWPTRDGLRRLVRAGRVLRLGPVGQGDWLPE